MRCGPTANSYWVVPARLAAGEYPGAKSEADARAKLAELLSAGIRVFTDLAEEGELPPYADLLRQESSRIGVRTEWRRMPIPDASVPSASHMTRILRTMADVMVRGQILYFELDSAYEWAILVSYCTLD